MSYGKRIDTLCSLLEKTDTFADVGCDHGYCSEYMLKNELCDFADKLETACIDTLNDGIMTKDLVGLVSEGYSAKAVNSYEFIKEIRARLEKKFA